MISASIALVVGIQGTSKALEASTDLRKLDASIRRTRDVKRQIQLLHTVEGHSERLE